MKTQKYNQDEIYPDDFDEDGKLQFDMYLEQSEMLSPSIKIRPGIFQITESSAI